MPGTLAIDLGSSTTVLAWQCGSEPARLLDLPPYSVLSRFQAADRRQPG